MNQSHYDKILELARMYKAKNKNKDLENEDFLVMALEELDDGFGIFVDPTRDEYDDLISVIAGYTV